MHRSASRRSLEEAASGSGASRRFTAQSSVVLLAWILTVSGCVLPLLEQALPIKKLPNYDGADCHGVRLADSASIESDVVGHLCGWKDPVDYEQAIERRHKTFDDRHPDLVVAALNVTDCARTEGIFPVSLGMCSYYADLVDEASVTAAVARVGVSESLKHELVWASTHGKPIVAAMVEKLDPRRKHLYVDVPLAVVAKRRAYFEGNAALYAKLDALEARTKEALAAQKAPTELVDALVALRGEYLGRCGNPDCRFDPFVIETTQELVRLAVAGNDELLAHTENHVLQEPAAGRHLFSVETGTALYEATMKESKDYELYRSAKGTLDSATLVARFGSPPPIHIDPQSDWIGSDSLPDMTFVLGDGKSKDRWVEAGGVVHAVTDAGRQNGRGAPLSRVSFRDVVSKEGIESCYETGKITGVSFDSSGRGTINYQTVCRTIGTKTNVEKVQPVLVPKSEAQALEPGEVLVALVASDSREGLVLQSTAKENAAAETQGRAREKTPVLQVRSHRFGR